MDRECTVVMVAGEPVSVEAGQVMTRVCDALDGQDFLWLNPGIAAEFQAGHSSLRQLEALRAACDEQRVDLVSVPRAGRRKRILVADMDSTIIGQECIDELGVAAGIGEEIAEVTRKAMNGMIGFEDAIRSRIRRLSGMGTATIEQILENRITLTPGAVELVGTMRDHGAYCVLISGGYTIFTERVSAWTGFHENHANRLVIEDGCLTGAVESPILDKDAKLEILSGVTERLGIGMEDVLAVGDGANDIPMLAAAGMGIAFHAKPVVVRSTSVHVRHADLRALLYFQGYSECEFTVFDRQAS